MPKKQRVVWFVDDLDENLIRFRNDHADEFDVRTFSKPRQILEALDEGKHPNLLLCDVYFYEPIAKAKKVEARVRRHADALQALAIEIEANDDKHIAGVGLMEDIRDRYKGKVPFPMCAYTSKGPYLLQQNGWDRIVKAGGEIFLKNRFGNAVERNMFENLMDRFEERTKLVPLIKQELTKIRVAYWTVAASASAISGGVGIVIGALWKQLFGLC